MITNDCECDWTVIFQPNTTPVTEYIKINEFKSLSFLTKFLNIFKNIKTLDLLSFNFEKIELSQKINLPSLISLMVFKGKYLRYFVQINTLTHLKIK